jgi:hypothetical protein
MTARYVLRHGSYYLIEPTRQSLLYPDGERIITMVDQVSVCINTAWSCLVGSGAPERVEGIAKARREQLRAFGDDDAAEGIIVVTFPRNTADSVVNAFLDNPMKALDDYDLKVRD